MKFQSQITEFLTAVLLLFSSLPLISQDTIPPAIRCKTGVVIVLPVDGEITVAAKEFDDGSLDNFTPQNQLKFYLDDDPSKTSYTVTCDSFSARGVLEEFRQEFYLNVEDQAGNVSACQVELIIQDNKFICGRPILVCSGCVRTWNRDQDFLPVRIGCSNDTSSCYSIEIAQPTELDFCRNWDNLNGVSTADIVLIQRHLLGLAEFEYGLQYYAADANNTESVSAADISTIRKIILGVIDDFSDYDLDSWRFFRQMDSVTYQEGPIIFSDSLNCPEVTDLMAVKVGDVHPPQGGFNKNITREDPTIGVRIVNDHGSNLFSVTLAEEISIVGLEMVVKLNGPFEGAGLIPGELDLGSVNYNLAGNELRISWNTHDGQAINVMPGQALFSIDAGDDVEFEIRSGEVYDQDVNTLILIPFQYEVESAEVYPNPGFAGQDVFLNAEGSIGSVTAIDLNGRETVLKFELSARGAIIGKGQLQAGIYILKLSYRDGSHDSLRLVIL